MHVGDENSPANLRNTPKSMAISNFRSGSMCCPEGVSGWSPVHIREQS
jgi:hypothetical protein